MTHEEFVSSLESAGWAAKTKSLLYKRFGEWQVSFIRMGGRYQEAGHVAFVVCVRHTSLRNMDEEIVEAEKEPHSYPFKLSLPELQGRKFQYQSKLLNYEVSKLKTDEDWSVVHGSLERVLPEWLATLTKDTLAKQIAKFGESGYIEKVWLEDLGAL
jgi:hypothetical protein